LYLPVLPPAKANKINKMIAEKFSNLGKEIDIQIHEALRTLNRQDWRRSSPHYIMVKMARVQNKEYLKLQDRSTKMYMKTNLSENIRPLIRNAKEQERID
jgi:hypothetical protein